MKYLRSWSGVRELRVERGIETFSWDLIGIFNDGLAPGCKRFLLAKGSKILWY